LGQTFGLILALGAIGALGAVPAQAGDRIGIGVKAGTLGLGVDLTGRFNNWFSVRGTLSKYDYDDTFTESDIEYDGTLKLGAYGVMLDFYPMKGAFRLSAGLLKNRNELDMSGTPTADIDIGDTTYTPAEVGTLDGGVQFKDTVSYFGIGFGNAAKAPGRVRFVFDLGVLAQGAGDVTLSSSTGLVNPADLQEEEKQIEDDIDSYKYWPVVAFGISFRL
jgi:hypothetical protein